MDRLASSSTAAPAPQRFQPSSDTTWTRQTDQSSQQQSTFSFAEYYADLDVEPELLEMLDKVRREPSDDVLPPGGIVQYGGARPDATSTHVIESCFLSEPSLSCPMCTMETTCALTTCTHLQEHCLELTMSEEEQEALLVTGSGGEGMVICATFYPLSHNGTASRSRRNGRPVALKALHSSSLEVNSLAKDTLVEEMTKLLFLSNSDSILHCYGHTSLAIAPFTCDGLLTTTTSTQGSESKRERETPFVVMEYAPFGDLHEILYLYAEASDNADVSPLPLALLIQWMLDISKGVRDMHMFSLRHRDIKPKNILVFEDLKVKLGDFGLAKYHTEEISDANHATFDNMHDLHARSMDQSGYTTVASDSSSIVTDYTTNDTSGVTTKTVIAGTRGYIAPERSQTIASDIFSLGITFVHMINHRYSPSAGWKEQARIASEKLLAWNEEDPEMRQMLSILIEQMLDSNPINRPTAETLVDSLSGFLDGCLGDLSKPAILRIERNIRKLSS